MNTTVKDHVVYDDVKTDRQKKISWASIWAGVLIGITTLILLNLLGLGVGFGALDVQEEQAPAKGLGIGAGIWYLISSLVALFVAGWVAGRLAQTRKLFDGALHGVLTWCIITFISLYFLTTTIGNVIGGAGRLVGNTLSTVGKASGTALATAAPAISEQMGDIDLSEIRNSGATQQVVDLLKNAGGDPAKVDRAGLANLIASQTGRTPQEASGAVDSLVTKYQNAAAQFQSKKQELVTKGKATADDVAKAASTTFILAFFAFLVGAIAAAFGARMGTQSKENINFERTAAVRV